ncbi:MAG: hypothetical protein P1U89_07175 [Verrucomicrobiales bacterium]|nr:hypothetical protein [Verrucomicrobiales bacterium]
MKVSVLSLVVLGMVSIAQAAEPFVAPDFVRELEDLDEVKKQAESGNKAVSFLLMEPGST